MNRLARGAKRALDICCSATTLVVLSPVMVLTALAVRIWLGAPVLFRQMRPGLNGHLFTILKFRTMTDERDATGTLLPDARRLHGIGKVLRRTSLDELPQLINVLRGEMSLVGPRPLLAEYVARYSPAQARRLLVKPGLTGWAQVNGRNAINWKEKFQCDIWYVDHASFLLDLRILWMTLGCVVRGSGISSEGLATMPRFMGDNADGL